jgi:NAD-dependent dihydropyrimidine dehydrogenase PreA subunit
VISIDGEQCTGCGACVEVCPTGALYLVEGKAAVDGALCRECEVCLAACPTGAIALATHEGPAVEPIRVPTRRPEPEVIRVKAQTAPVPLRARVLPMMGAALAWAGREILPRLADSLLDTLDRRTAAAQATGEALGRETVAPGAKGGGQQRRQRRRRGGGSR